MTLRALRSGLAASVVTAVAMGCAGFPFSGQTDNDTRSTAGVTTGIPSSTGGTHPIAAFLSAARPGDSTYLTLPETGGRAQVTAHRVYFAASGRYCRRYDVISTNSATTVSYGLACRNDQGEWKLEHLLVNPNDVNAPQRSRIAPGSSP